MMNVVLDTNCLLMSLARYGQYYDVWRKLVAGEYVLCYTNDILAEYEEVLTQKLGSTIAGNVISTLLNLQNTKQVEVFYKMQMIKADPDDNKFVDCAFKANAHFIVTQDHHFDVLNEIDYPKIFVMSIDEFLSVLRNNS